MKWNMKVCGLENTVKWGVRRAGVCQGFSGALQGSLHGSLWVKWSEGDRSRGFACNRCMYYFVRVCQGVSGCVRV